MTDDEREEPEFDPSDDEDIGDEPEHWTTEEMEDLDEDPASEHAEWESETVENDAGESSNSSGVII